MQMAAEKEFPEDHAACIHDMYMYSIHNINYV